MIIEWTYGEHYQHQRYFGVDYCHSFCGGEPTIVTPIMDFITKARVRHFTVTSRVRHFITKARTRHFTTGGR